MGGCCFLFLWKGAALISYTLCSVAWFADEGSRSLQMKGLGHLQSLAGPREQRCGTALWHLASFWGEAWSQ